MAVLIKITPDKQLIESHVFPINHTVTIGIKFSQRIKAVAVGRSSCSGFAKQFGARGNVTIAV